MVGQVYTISDVIQRDKWLYNGPLCMGRAEVWLFGRLTSLNNLIIYIELSSLFRMHTNE
jgi:hypothetical protein